MPPVQQATKRVKRETELGRYASLQSRAGEITEAWLRAMATRWLQKRAIDKPGEDASREARGLGDGQRSLPPLGLTVCTVDGSRPLLVNAVNKAISESSWHELGVLLQQMELWQSVLHQPGAERPWWELEAASVAAKGQPPEVIHLDVEPDSPDAVYKRIGQLIKAGGGCEVHVPRTHQHDGKDYQFWTWNPVKRCADGQISIELHKSSTDVPGVGMVELEDEGVVKRGVPWLMKNRDPTMSGPISRVPFKVKDEAMQVHNPQQEREPTASQSEVAPSDEGAVTEDVAAEGAAADAGSLTIATQAGETGTAAYVEEGERDGVNERDDEETLQLRERLHIMSEYDEEHPAQMLSSHGVLTNGKDVGWFTNLFARPFQWPLRVGYPPTAEIYAGLGTHEHFRAKECLQTRCSYSTLAAYNSKDGIPTTSGEFGPFMLMEVHPEDNSIRIKGVDVITYDTTDQSDALVKGRMELFEFEDKILLRPTKGEFGSISLIEVRRCQPYQSLNVIRLPEEAYPAEIDLYDLREVEEETTQEDDLELSFYHDEDGWRGCWHVMRREDGRLQEIDKKRLGSTEIDVWFGV